MPRVFTFDLLTGEIGKDLPHSKCRWSDPINAAERISVDLVARDPDVRRLGLYNLATPFKTGIGVATGDVIHAAGPLWLFDYEADAGIVSLDAAGMASYWDYRNILPIAAKSLGLDKFTIPDPSAAGKTMPNPAVRTLLENLSLGTIAKRWVQQAQTWTGGNVPVVFQPDELGVEKREVLGTDFKSIGEAQKQLTQVDGGPDINYKPMFVRGGRFVEWLLETGTNAQPMITSPEVRRWDLSVVEASASKIHLERDGRNAASLAWGSGGRSSDTVLVARASSDELLNLGYALAEAVDTSRSSVDTQSTLDALASDLLALGQRPMQTISFSAQAHSQPRIGTYATGDMCELKIANDPVLPSDTYKQRIVQLSGDENDNVVQITCAPRREA